MPDDFYRRAVVRRGIGGMQYHLLYRDIHGDIRRILKWLDQIRQQNVSNAVLILLGDAGLNYYLDERDMKQKERLQRKINELKEEKIFVQILFVRGNHEARPSKLDTYKEKLVYDGLAYVEEKYPDLIFLKDGECYTIEGKRFLVIGGGYSKDFFERVFTWIWLLV